MATVGGRGMTHIPSLEQMHENMLSDMADHLAELSENDRADVIHMAKARASNFAYNADLDPVKDLAMQVTKLNGYALGAFMKFVMQYGDHSENKS